MRNFITIPKDKENSFEAIFFSPPIPRFTHLGNLNVIFSFCREINGEKKNFCLVTNPRKKLKYRMFTEVES